MVTKTFSKSQKILLGTVLLLIIGFFSCETPTGGDYVRPYVTFSDIEDLDGVPDDTLLTSRDINLQAEDNEGIDRVELYVIYLTGTDTILPVKTFSGIDKESNLSYTWNIDNSVRSGEYKVLAAIHDEVGNYYQEFRNILVRGFAEGDAAISGRVTRNGSNLAGAKISWKYAGTDSIRPNPLSRASGVSRASGQCVLLGLSPDTTRFAASAYAFGDYVSEREVIRFYNNTPMPVDSNNSITNVDFGIDDAQRNYDQLQLSNVLPADPVEIFIDTNSVFIDTAHFSFDYVFKAADASGATPAQTQAWLVVGIENNPIATLNGTAVSLGQRSTIGFEPGVSGSLALDMIGPRVTPNETYNVYASFVFAANVNAARNAYINRYDAGDVVRIGRFSVLLQGD